MLIISPELALAFETGTVGRWKLEIAAQLRHHYPDAAARFPGPALETWAREAMEVLRRHGNSSRPDLELFTTTLFAVTEAAPDQIAAGDLLAILLGPGSFAARMKLLHKAFALPAV